MSAKPRQSQPSKVRPFKRAVEERGYSYTTMRDAHFRGELAVIRVGRAWYVTDSELDRFTDAHVVVAATA